MPLARSPWPAGGQQPGGEGGQAVAVGQEGASGHVAAAQRWPATWRWPAPDWRQQLDRSTRRRRLDGCSGGGLATAGELAGDRWEASGPPAGGQLIPTGGRQRDGGQPAASTGPSGWAAGRQRCL